MNESLLRLDFTSLYRYSFRELNSFPQLLLNLLLFRSSCLVISGYSVKLSLAFRRLLGSKSVSSSFSCNHRCFCFVVCDRSIVHLTLFDEDHVDDVRILIGCCSLFGGAVVILLSSE
ncbi:Hypothetical_protein [Hexamita inflata]|uniref:Hypothetical_protein n=1 Tax=Hexamita inflata TaxID=28002 RepID=A0AA86U290_9EUKA|nr:Hypothetical protein HINF_LOCUS24886 [Hexamita inflata]